MAYQGCKKIFLWLFSCMFISMTFCTIIISSDIDKDTLTNNNSKAYYYMLITDSICNIIYCLMIGYIHNKSIGGIIEFQNKIVGTVYRYSLNFIMCYMFAMLVSIVILGKPLHTTLALICLITTCINILSRIIYLYNLPPISANVMQYVNNFSYRDDDPDNFSPSHQSHPVEQLMEPRNEQTVVENIQVVMIGRNETVTRTFVNNYVGPTIIEDKIKINLLSFETIQNFKDRELDYNCVICLSKFTKTDKCRILSCGHLFHSGCLDNWLSNNPTCPVCRLNVSI